jgi:hypothetical protein
MTNGLGCVTADGETNRIGLKPGRLSDPVRKSDKLPKNFFQIYSHVEEIRILGHYWYIGMLVTIKLANLWRLYDDFKPFG